MARVFNNDWLIVDGMSDALDCHSPGMKLCGLSCAFSLEALNIEIFVIILYVAHLKLF